MKVLFYDIETRPNVAYVWGKWEQNVIEYVKEWELLSVAYKWQGEKKIHCVSREGEETDRSVAEKLHALFQEADVLVAHNGDSFDFKKLKARMLYHRLPATKVIKLVDTKKIAKRYFAFNGNGLDDLGQHLGLGRKFKHPGFSMWKGCMADDPKSWKQMVFYNKKDVELLESVHDTLQAGVPIKEEKLKVVKVKTTNVKVGKL